MQFEYRAYNSNGEIITGVLAGASDHEVIEKLGEKDLMVVSLTQDTLKQGRARANRVQVPLIVLAPATRELATMIRAGLSLVRCLGALERQSKHRGLQLVLRDVSRFIEGGSSFSEALRVYSSVFSPVYIAMVSAGENGGLLPEVLDRMASYLEMSLRLRQRVRSAMMYPIIVGFVGLGICIFMTTKIIPVFAGIFQEFHHKLPLPTLILIEVSAWVRAHLLACLATGVGTGLALRVLRRTAEGQHLWDRLKLRLPVCGPLAGKIAFSRFARTFAFMMHSGVPVLKALNIAGAAVCNVELEEVIRQVGDRVEKGDTIHDAMVKEKKFPSMMLEMVAVGEEAGSVDELLLQVANHYDQEIDATLNGLTALLEPILILVLGVIVGAVVIAMFLPIFRMTDAVQF
jgi:type IV pilus assembly protein PilC